MGLSIVENISGLQESVFSLFGSPKLNSRNTSKNWSTFILREFTCELTSSWPPAHVEVGLEGHVLDHFREANYEGKLRPFFKNGNLRFLTHSRDLGAIPPPKWSYGRRAYFYVIKISQTIHNLKICLGAFSGEVFAQQGRARGPGARGPGAHMGPGPYGRSLAYQIFSIPDY